MPPPGYESPHTAATSTTTPLLSMSALSEKELWYFTLPKHLPISSIKDTNPRHLLESNRAFSYHSADFEFVKVSQSRDVEMYILHPEPSGTAFKPLEVGLNRSFTVARCANAVIAGTLEPSRVLRDSQHLLYPKNSPRQPQELKLRYRPTGCGSDVPDAKSPQIAMEQRGFKTSEKSGRDHSRPGLHATANYEDSPMSEHRLEVRNLTDGSLASDQAKKKKKLHHGTSSENRVPRKDSQSSKPRKSKLNL